jgi:hypothetical protein
MLRAVLLAARFCKRVLVHCSHLPRCEGVVDRCAVRIGIAGVWDACIASLPRQQLIHHPMYSRCNLHTDPCTAALMAAEGMLIAYCTTLRTAAHDYVGVMA